MSMEVSSVETPAGDVQNFQVQIKMGPSPHVIEGHIRDGVLTIVVADQQQRRVAWEKQTAGFFAVEQSLRRSPMVTRTT